MVLKRTTDSSKINYDKNGYDENGFDKNGWNEDGINKETNIIYDKNGFNIYIDMMKIDSIKIELSFEKMIF